MDRDELDYTGLEVNEDTFLDYEGEGSGQILADMQDDAAPVATAPAHAAPAHAAPNEESEAYEMGHEAYRRAESRRLPATIAGGICAAIAVICLGLFIFAMVVRPSGASRLLGGLTGSGDDLSDNRASVLLPVYVPGLDSKGSRIPVKLRGTLADGSAYDKEAFVAEDGSGLKLAPGTYELSVLGSPISSSGVIYEYPSTHITITVSDSLAVTLDPSTSLTFWEIGALEATDSQIEAALELLDKDPERKMYKEALTERAYGRREEALREIEEAKARAAQEAAERAAAEQQMAEQNAEQTTEQTQTTDYTEGQGNSQYEGGNQYSYDQNQGYTDDTDYSNQGTGEGDQGSTSGGETPAIEPGSGGSGGEPIVETTTTTTGTGTGTESSAGTDA